MPEGSLWYVDLKAHAFPRFTALGDGDTRDGKDFTQEKECKPFCGPVVPLENFFFLVSGNTLPVVFKEQGNYCGRFQVAAVTPTTSDFAWSCSSCEKFSTTNVNEIATSRIKPLMKVILRTRSVFSRRFTYLNPRVELLSGHQSCSSPCRTLPFDSECPFRNR